MDDIAGDSGRLTWAGTLNLFVTTLVLMVKDFRVLLPVSLLTAALAFVIQHFVDAEFSPSYHFMDAICYLTSWFCTDEDLEFGEPGSLVGIIHTVAATTARFLTHAASVLIDLAACTLLLAPLLRCIAMRTDSLTAYSSERSTRIQPKKLMVAFKDHLIPSFAIFMLGLASLFHGSIPGFAGLSMVPIPFTMMGTLIFSVAPIGLSRNHNIMAIAEVAFFHKPVPMLVFMALAGPLMLVSPFAFLLLPYLVAVNSQIYVALISDPDQQTPAGSVMKELGAGISMTFGGSKTS